jgi:hypothetical protein
VRVTASLHDVKRRSYQTLLLARPLMRRAESAENAVTRRGDSFMGVPPGDGLDEAGGF